MNLNLRLIHKTPISRALFALALACSLAPTGCALYRRDRCYLEDEKYSIARGLFIESGSLDLTQRRLETLQWQTCEVNEALYRIEKEFEVQR